MRATSATTKAIVAKTVSKAKAVSKFVNRVATTGGEALIRSKPRDIDKVLAELSTDWSKWTFAYYVWKAGVTEGAGSEHLVEKMLDPVQGEPLGSVLNTIYRAGRSGISWAEVQPFVGFS